LRASLMPDFNEQGFGFVHQVIGCPRWLKKASQQSNPSPTRTDTATAREISSDDLDSAQTPGIIHTMYHAGENHPDRVRDGGRLPNSETNGLT